MISAMPPPRDSQSLGCDSAASRLDPAPLSSERLDGAPWAGCLGQPPVRGDQHGVQNLGERHVHRVPAANRLAQLPGTTEQQPVAEPLPGQAARSSIAWSASVRSSVPRRRSRRRTLNTSTSMTEGAAWSGSAVIRPRIAAAPGPSMSTSHRHDASTTSIWPRATVLVERLQDGSAAEGRGPPPRALQPFSEAWPCSQTSCLGP